jgi:hypothetical protein
MLKSQTTFKLGNVGKKRAAVWILEFEFYLGFGFWDLGFPPRQ